MEIEILWRLEYICAIIWREKNKLKEECQKLANNFKNIVDRYTEILKANKK